MTSSRHNLVHVEDENDAQKKAHVKVRILLKSDHWAKEIQLQYSVMCRCEKKEDLRVHGQWRLLGEQHDRIGLSSVV